MLFYILYNLARKTSGITGMPHYTACIFMSLLVYANLSVAAHVLSGETPYPPDPDTLITIIIFPVHITICHIFIDRGKYLDIIRQYGARSSGKQVVLKKNIIRLYIIASLVLPAVVRQWK
ncbi:hypothetical protein [Sinomicrobium soli]|uniref:hypothetical protein n=1 Tax=Sinomicrobium sp. N-1-3-6 TaxID=2219864 RepID=UPI000DCE5A43|nr:hypothetical protein [Sinomicrobium sp. N-1-3-6]RAV30454.1 hypothetical protein DN748_02815 [Sinomicrobium sp. N-1-3-6]